MARTKVSSAVYKENKKTSATNASKNSKARNATGKPLTRKDTNAIDVPLTSNTSKNVAPAPKGRCAAKQTTAGSSLILQPVDTNVGEVGKGEAVANTSNISNNQTDSQTPATDTAEDLAASNAALREQLRKSDARLEAVNATLMRLQALEDAKPRSEALIPAPKVKPYCLIMEMGLENDRLLYNACQATVRETIKARYEAYKPDWRKQDPDFISSARSLIEKRQPILKNYERGWATLEMMRTYMKGKRGYLALLAKLRQEHYAAAEQLFGGINLSAVMRPVPVVPDSDVEDNTNASRVKKVGALKKTKKVVVVVEDEDEEEEVAEKRKGRGRKKAELSNEEDDEDEDEENVAKKRKERGRKRTRVAALSSEEEEEEEEEEEVAEKRKGRGRKKARVVETSGEEDNVSDAESAGDLDEEQVPVKAKKTNGNPGKAPKDKKVKKKSK